MSTEELNPDLRQSDAKCYIYFIAVKLDKNGFSHRIKKIECKETEKTYLTPTKRISKNKIMKTDTRFHESHMWQHFFTFCLEGQQQEALDMLKLHIIENITRIKSQVDELCKWLP